MAVDTTIYFLRHGITDSNKKGIWQLSLDEDLSPEGVEQARKVSVAIEGLRPDVVVSSPMKRALITAQIVSEEVGIGSIVTIPELAERKGGVIEGMTSQQIHDKFGISIHTILDVSIDRLSGVEPVDAFSQRVMSAVRKIEEKYRGKRILVVTHGGVIRAFYTFFVSNNSDRRVFRNCSILGVKREAGTWAAFYFLDTEYQQ